MSDIFLTYLNHDLLMENMSCKILETDWTFNFQKIKFNF